VRLAGVVALVTGASSGIGAATAAALARAGATLVVSGRDEQRLSTVAAQTGAAAIVCDLAAPGGAEHLVRQVLDCAGRVDLLVCNAGTGWAGPITELPAAKADELVALNLLAPIQLARLLAPSMAERGSGRLVFVSSIAGATGVRNEAAYAATKAGLNVLAESLGYELAGSGVGVSVILPGVVQTPFFSHRGHPYDRRRPAPIPADRVASAIIRAAERDLRVVFVPGWLAFPAWLHGTAPRAYRALAARFG
jgi:short-subunit dehydrogenase